MTDERYHYVECGLDDVYLANGFERFESARGTSVAIQDVDSLHRAIAEHLCDRKKDLNGKEIRFLRREMLMSQAALAHMLGVKEQTVHRWEAGKTGMPKAAESILRFLYMERVEASGNSLRDALKRIAELEDGIHLRQQMIFAFKKIARAKRSPRRRPAAARWALAA